MRRWRLEQEGERRAAEQHHAEDAAEEHGDADEAFVFLLLGGAAVALVGGVLDHLLDEIAGPVHRLPPGIRGEHGLHGRSAGAVDDADAVVQQVQAGGHELLDGGHVVLQPREAVGCLIEAAEADLDAGLGGGIGRPVDGTLGEDIGTGVRFRVQQIDQQLVAEIGDPVGVRRQAAQIGQGGSGAQIERDAGGDDDDHAGDHEGGHEGHGAAHTPQAAHTGSFNRLRKAAWAASSSGVGCIGRGSRPAAAW